MVMRRVMIVTNSIAGGGAERSMNLVSSELTRRHWPVAMVPINSSEPDLITPTCEVFPLNRQWRGGIYGTFVALMKFNRLARSWKPDVVILNTDLPELFGSLLLRNSTLVIIEHSNLAWANRTGFGRIVRKILSLRGGIWVAVSSHLRIWPGGQSPRAVLQNPLTPSIGSLERPDTSPHLQRLIFIGRMSPEKRPERMLDITAGCGAKVEFIGGGALRESLQSEAASKKLKVTFHGFVHDPWSYVQLGDLLIVPSASEGDGLIVIEAMKRGIPILLSDIPDFRRFALPERNYCKNVEDFIARISRYCEDLNSLVVSDDIAAPILSNRSLDIVGDDWERFLNSIYE